MRNWTEKEEFAQRKRNGFILDQQKSTTKEKRKTNKNGILRMYGKKEGGDSPTSVPFKLSLSIYQRSSR